MRFTKGAVRIGVLLLVALVAWGLSGRDATPMSVAPGAGESGSAESVPIGDDSQLGEFDEGAHGTEAGDESADELNVQLPIPGDDSRQIDLDMLRERLGAEESVPATGEGWQTEIAVGSRGSIRIGYAPFGDGVASPPEGRLDAEILYDLIGPTSIAAGYRLLSFHDPLALEANRDAFARAEIQVRF